MIRSLLSRSNWRPALRLVYHRLPISQRAKWRLRERLMPLLAVLQSEPTVRSVVGGVLEVVRARSVSVYGRDIERERAMAGMLIKMAVHAKVHGPIRHWLALPFLGVGGAERAAQNFCRAIAELQPSQSVVLWVTDRRITAQSLSLPPQVLTMVIDDDVGSDLGPERKKALLRDLLLATRPDCFHNINSVVAWNLIADDGGRLQHYTRLFACIFAFQFGPDGRTKIGYASTYLSRCLPYLSGVISDNRRFIEDAAQEYQFTQQEKTRLHVLYQPCRISCSEREFYRDQRENRKTAPSSEGEAHRRPQVLWAGRLDAEKRVDFFLDIVRKCAFADFRIFGQAVLDKKTSLPRLANLSYEGPYLSPCEWVKRFEFDAFVFTSRWEGLPNVLVEAGALGIPVIAPAVGGIGELITESTGYLLPARPTIRDYEQALQGVLENPKEAVQRAARLQQLVAQRHSWQAFVTDLAKIERYVTPQRSVPGLCFSETAYEN